MIHLGDITKINGATVEPVNVIIGGFPLIWEWLNGKGSCLWASEIEDFPIAVTKEQFSDEVPEDDDLIPLF